MTMFIKHELSKIVMMLTTRITSRDCPGAAMLTMVVGSGYLGGRVGARMRDARRRARCSAPGGRRPPRSAAGTEWQRARRTRPARPAPTPYAASRRTPIVVVHGPSDITWCEEHADETDGRARRRGRQPRRRRRTGAHAADLDRQRLPRHPAQLRRVRRAGARQRVRPRQAAPANGPCSTPARRWCCGSASSTAGTPTGTGPTTSPPASRAPGRPPGRRARRPLEHPGARRRRRRLVGRAAAAGRTGVLHLGGPERLSRHEWAGRIAKGLGLDDGPVRPVGQGRHGVRLPPPQRLPAQRAGRGPARNSRACGRWTSTRAPAAWRRPALAGEPSTIGRIESEQARLPRQQTRRGQLRARPRHRPAARVAGPRRHRQRGRRTGRLPRRGVDRQRGQRRRPPRRRGEPRRHAHRAALGPRGAAPPAAPRPRDRSASCRTSSPPS